MLPPFPRAFRSIPVAALALVAASCATPGPVPRVDPGVEAAARIGPAVEFRTEGEPVDLDGTGPAHLGAAAAVEQGLRHDPRLQAAFARVRAAEAEAGQARLLPNPILSLALRLPAGGGTPALDLGLTQDLFAVVQRPGRALVADHRLRAAASECLATALDVVAEVEEAYAAVQAAEARRPLDAERADLLRRIRDTASARLAAGEGTGPEVTALEEEILAAAIEGDERRAAVLRARRRLARLLGRPGAEPTWTVDPATDAPPAPPERACVAAALARRPELAVLSWEIAALGGEGALADLPMLDGASAGPDAEGWGEWETGIAAEIPLPLFDSGEARRDLARARIVEARHRLVGARRGVVEEVRDAWWTLEDSRRARDRIRDERIPLGRKRGAEVEAAFRAGETASTALLLAEGDLHDARSQLAEAEERIASARIRLRRAVGGPLALSELESPQHGGTP